MFLIPENKKMLSPRAEDRPRRWTLTRGLEKKRLPAEFFILEKKSGRKKGGRRSERALLARSVGSMYKKGPGHSDVTKAPKSHVCFPDQLIDIRNISLKKSSFVQSQKDTNGDDWKLHRSAQEALLKTDMNNRSENSKSLFLTRNRPSVDPVKC